ncbi:hypothetical protein QBC44DRAFT_382374 [Cladorrhinum sp. PSN332]|nr:hypothetical protein QBC44DRAFT_382374 [Cladorrhinum sp. PSN332]
MKAACTAFVASGIGVEVGGGHGMGSKYLDQFPRPLLEAVCILQEWPQQQHQQQQAFASPPYSFTNLSYTGFELEAFDTANWDLSFTHDNNNSNNILVTQPPHLTPPQPSLVATPDIVNLDFDYNTLDLSQIPLSFPDLEASISPYPPSNIPTPSCTGNSNTDSSSSSPICSIELISANLIPGLKLPTPAPSVSPSVPKPKGRPGRKPTKKRPRSSSPDEADEEEDPDVIDKRQRNNLAAKRYRQKKVDRIEELEGEVKEVSKERDELKLEVARKDAEIKALREMLEMVQRDRDRERDKGK